MTNPYVFSYKGYVIQINEGLSYVIIKDEKIITKCDQIPFSSRPDAEIHAKMLINKIEAKNKGWDLVQ